jgi:RNA 2',3'-cyclic 3'-phosphodiesterase
MRLFLAANFPMEVLRDLGDRLARVRSRLPAASWVRPETQHLTFAFLGERPESLLDAIAPPLETSLGALPKFEARLRGCGFFPNPRRARVGWVGLDPESRFTSIANNIRAVVLENGVSLDRSDFKAHLTLMRIRDPWPPASSDLFSRTLRDYESAPFAVDRVTLYSSQLHRNGAIHTPLRAFELAG